MPQRFTLRARLVATLVVLATLGLLTAGVAINKQLETYLLSRIDQQLVDASAAVYGRLQGGDPLVGHGGPPGRPPANVPVGTYGALYADNGARLAEFQLSFTSDGTVITPNTTAVLSRPEVTQAEIQAVTTQGPAFYTVPASGEISPYRVMLVPRGDYVLAIGMPMSDITATLSQLFWLEFGVGLIVLLLLGGLTYVIVRAELHPLQRMSQTASAIAGGDLSHRVDVAAGGTEVGELGNALNIMLQRIEEAFAARQASEDRLRRFVADASHELRTPLTSIRGYAEMFHRGADSEPADLATVMRRIEQESQRMSVLVDDLLLLARLDQQRELGSELVSLRRVVLDVVMDTRAAHPDHNVTTGTVQDISMLGDEDAIRQALVNLARNACVHTPAGTLVTMSLTQQADQDVITVADAGPGIETDLAGEVFERFTRADTSRVRDSGGAGLGLSIASAIAQAHAGSLTLSTTPGGGATFTLMLPISVRN